MMDRAKLEEALKHPTWWGGSCIVANLTQDQWLAIFTAAEAHLATLPKTKVVQVWHVERAINCRSGWSAHVCLADTREEAERIAVSARTHSNTACVRVTGPHAHEVPA